MKLSDLTPPPASHYMTGTNNNGHALPRGALPAGFIDPTGHHASEHPDSTAADVINMCGFLPGWFLNATEQNPDSTEGLAALLAEQYGFGWPVMPEGSTITETGVYTYPDDPPLHPLAAFRAPGGALMLVYPYGITAVRVSNSAPWSIARLD